MRPFSIITTLILATIFVSTLFARSPAAYEGPLAPIASGYGQWGGLAVAPAESFTMDIAGHTNTVFLYYPVAQAAAAPTIFFGPGWSLPCDAYAEFFHFLVSKGYTVVCDDYVEETADIGTQMREAFIEAATRYPARINTAKFGLSGHSAGAGVLTSVGYALVEDEEWGAQGKFIFSSAPWFDFDITDAMLADYPSDMKLIMHTYEDDFSTDLRTYIDQFESLTTIADTEKEYVTLRPATISGYDYAADHRVLATGGSGYGAFNALDDYGVFRLIDALADYAFTGSPEGKNVALGDGSVDQVGMGDLPDLVSTDDPRPNAGVPYGYVCDHPINPRRTHCADFDNSLPASVLITPTKHITLPDGLHTFRWEPVPTAAFYDFQLRPMLPTGDPDWTISFGVNDLSPAAANCANGEQFCEYTISSDLPDDAYVWWIRPEQNIGDELGAWSRRGLFQENVAPTAITLTEHSVETGNQAILFGAVTLSVLLTLGWVGFGRKQHA